MSFLKISEISRTFVMQDLFSQVYVLTQLDLIVNSFEGKGTYFIIKLQRQVYLSGAKSKNPLSFNSFTTPSLSQIINEFFVVHFTL